ncbi:hypothetical protein QBC44DRAFT_382503 [Cladorrhinum sp. PSN332]|nr:hypothetical protein QBC44DRAFT_382503 [Cladorrhinum sp. PSN332]
MRRLRQLFRRDKEKSKPQDPLALAPPIPYLPPGIPAESWQPTDPQTASPFFAKIPAELRWQILCEAFGDRTIHIDFQLRHSPRFVDRAIRPESYHHGRFRGHSCSHPTRNLGPARWKWFSCICHHAVPPGRSSLGDNYIPSTRFHHCLKGSSNCDDWPGETPDKCHLGAMGFLLSCKRACGEVVEVVFATNRVILESKEMISALVRQYGLAPEAPRLMGPGFGMVTMMTLSVDYMLFGECPRRKRYDTVESNEFWAMLELLPKAFPRLTKLEIILGGAMYTLASPNPMKNFDKIEEVLLQPLLNMGQRLDELKEFCVAVPDGPFDMFRTPLHRRFPDHPEYKENYLLPKTISGLAWNIGERLWYPFTAEAQEQRGRPGNSGFWMKEGLSSAISWHWDGEPYFPGMVMSGNH